MRKQPGESLGREVPQEKLRGRILHPSKEEERLGAGTMNALALPTMIGVNPCL